MTEQPTGLRRLSTEELRKVCSPEVFANMTNEHRCTHDIIGQERAVRSVEFGLQVSSPGYNIFMAGATGTGKSTFARLAVSEKAADEPTPDDWCYLFNFAEPESPTALTLPAGKGSQFRDDMKELVEDARTAISHEFEGGNFEKQRTSIIEKFQKDINSAFEELDRLVRDKGFVLQRGSGGFASVPLDDEGEPLSSEDFAQLDDERKRELEKRGVEIQNLIRSSMRKVRQFEKETKSSIRDLEKRMGSFAIRPLIEQVQEKYAKHGEIQKYLENVHDDMINHLDQFKADDESEGPPMGLAMLAQAPRDFSRYEVNLLVSHAETQGAPVVEENNPTYYNLFGKMEYQSNMGQAVTNHTMVRPGAIHRANGGYLILRAEDVLQNALSWDALKRCLKSNNIRIENIGEQYRLVPTTTIKPEPIALQVKVILIGSSMIYYLLQYYDPDFSKYFKVKADFDVEMDRNENYLRQYCSFVRAVAARENLLTFDNTAIARIVDHGSRLTEDQLKLSARFNEVVEIVYEADAWARVAGASEVTAEHVEKAVDEKNYRSRLVEERVQESIARGKILVDTDGATVGQVNGLSVIGLGSYSFGRPSRITANTYLGNAGVINIDRQVKMSGSSHSKGVLILSGYLAEQFATDKPLSLSASITFEQLYGGVDGDSASSAELYALLSSLAQIPIKQSIAVTGSVNQKGEIQPIGGVNQKIEGFYYVCKAKGLTGEQGVLIPEQNVDNLMLNRDVLEAVEAGQFHVWAVSTVQQGIELMTGIPAGEKDEDGEYPAESIFGKVDARLLEMAERLKQFGQKNKSEKKDKASDPDENNTEDSDED